MRNAAMLFCLLVLAAALNAKEAKGPEPEIACKPTQEWKPGLTKDFPSMGAPECTLDIWIPKTYPTDTKRHFPIVYISGPGGNPGLFGLENWADRNGVLLVTINASKNGPDEPVQRAQKAALTTVETEFRLSGCLRFSMGMSGAAMCSLEIAIRHPDKHAGVLLMAHSGNGLIAPKHVCVAFVHGEKDTIQEPPYVDAAYKRHKAQGNPARNLTVPGRGHENATTAECETMLDWMLAVARATHPKLSPVEVQEYQAELKQHIETILAMPPGAARLKETELLLAIPGMEKKPETKPLLNAWFEDALSAAHEQKDPLPHYELLAPLVESERGKLVAGFAKEKKEIQAELAALRAKPPVKDEWDAQRAFDNCASMEAQAKGKTALSNAQQAYDAVAKRYPATKAGKAAAEASERLKSETGKKQ